MLNIKKKSKKSDLGTVITGPIGGDIGTANSAAGSFKGADLSALAKLRAAKKKPEMEAQLPRKKSSANAYDSEVGEFEVEKDEDGMFKESGDAAKQKYLERLRKRAK